MEAYSPTPKVSIGLPVYNGEKYLEGCIRNLLAQTLANFELVISDNCSTDRTQAICEAAVASDPRVKYHRADANKGATWNFNRVVELAKAPYFKWAAYDDLISAGFLEACVRSLDADPSIVIAYGITTLIDGEGAETETKPDRIKITAGAPSARLREYLYKVGLTNAIYGVMRTETMRRTSGHMAFPGSDIVLLGEFALLGRFQEIPEVVFYRRLHAAASNPSNPNLNALAAWFNPAHSKRVVLREWEHLRGYLAAIRRAPLGAFDKLRCYAVLIWFHRFSIGELAREAAIAVRAKLSRGIPAT